MSVLLFAATAALWCASLYATTTISYTKLTPDGWWTWFIRGDPKGLHAAYQTLGGATSVIGGGGWRVEREVNSVWWWTTPTPPAGWHFYYWSTTGFIVGTITDSYGRASWVVRIPWWFLLLVSVVYPTVWLRRRLRVRHAPDHCQVCGYDLRATPARCPECGTAVATKPAEAAA
jgi:hypothetical protein